jgi:two-component system, OmpR family, sensor kinase
LFELSQFALRESNVDALFERAVNLISETLNAAIVSILEYRAAEKILAVRAGKGWREGIVGQYIFAADWNSQSGYTLLSSTQKTHHNILEYEPVIVNELESEARFKPHPFLKEHGIQSGMSVVIYGKDENHPYGVLSAYSKTSRKFSPEEARFLQGAANTLAASIQRLALEAELKLRIEESNAAHRKRDEFLATLSHELRTPLNVIMGYANLLENLDPTSMEFGHAVQAIKRNAKTEAQLVSDTLEMSRIISGKMKIDRKIFSFQKVLDSALEAIRFAAQAKEISIESDISPETGAFAGDEDRLRQVVWNLLSNAVKFTPRRGKIRIEARREESTLMFSVKDNGKGIEQENLKHVFERFWQEDSSYSRQYMGLGLGLSIVRHIVELHGGTVSVFSEGLGKGTTFTVKLPIASVVEIVKAKSEDEAQVESQNLNEEPNESDLKGTKILLIDDSEDTLTLISFLLKREGAEIKGFLSPEKGLEEATSGNEYDIIISDIGMPGLDGYEFMRRYRNWEKVTRRSRTPAIALTAFASEMDKLRAQEVGYQLHVTKPVEIAKLRNSISKLIEPQSDWTALKR